MGPWHFLTVQSEIYQPIPDFPPFPCPFNHGNSVCCGREDPMPRDGSQPPAPPDPPEDPEVRGISDI